MASGFLSEASDAIAECNEQLLDCVQNPEPTASRIDTARVGLEGVVLNLTELEPPPEHAANHDLLLQGFNKVILGFSLYSQALRDREPGVLIDGLELIQEGKDDVSTATSSILGNEGPATNVILFVTVGVVGATVAMSVVLALLLLRLRKDRMSEVHRTLATCPVCGEVLDSWWTFRTRQIREWQRDHLKGHRSGGESASSELQG